MTVKRKTAFKPGTTMETKCACGKPVRVTTKVVDLKAGIVNADVFHAQPACDAYKTMELGAFLQYVADSKTGPKPDAGDE